MEEVFEKLQVFGGDFYSPVKMRLIFPNPCFLIETLIFEASPFSINVNNILLRINV